MDDRGSGEVTKNDDGVTNFELKQLQAQNEKLRETLVRMRDLSAHEKSESIKHQKLVEELKTQNADLSKSNEKYKSENDTLEAQISELQEQVDAGENFFFKKYFFFEFFKFFNTYSTRKVQVFEHMKNLDFQIS